MATYIVKPGDSLSAIAKRLGLSGWQELYNRNKSVIGSNPNLIRPGQVLIYGNDSSSSSPSTTTTPSTTVGNILAATVEDPTRQNFEKKYGMEADYYDANGNLVQGLRPDEMIMAVSEERVNPEQLRIANEYMSNLDWQRAISGSGAKISGSSMLARTNALNALERQRREAVNQYVQAQNDLFSKWYNQEMGYYMNSKAPSQYQMGKYVMAAPGGTSYTMSPNNTQKYSYVSPLDIRDVFKYGGYSRPAAMYGTPTPIYS